MEQQGRERSYPSQATASETADSKRAASYRRIKTAAWVVASCLTWLSIVYLPSDVLGPELMDPSCQGALSYFAEKQTQFGPEIMFTYGPLAYLVPEIYDGIFFKRKLISELISKLFMTLALVCIARQLPYLNRVFFFCFIWILATRFGHSYPEVFFYFCMAAVSSIFGVSDSLRRYFLALALGFLAFVSLIKFTHLVYSTVIVALLSAYWASRKNLKACLLIPSAYISLIFIAWAMAGQSWTNFPRWISTSLEVVSGYQQCMGLEPEAGILSVALAIAAVAASLFAISIYSLRKDLSGCFPLLCLAVGYWVSWKHGLVRADDHVNLFFGFCFLGFVAFPAFIDLSRYRPRIMQALSGLGCLLCLCGMYLQDSTFLTAGPTYAASNLFRTIRNLAFVTSYRETMRTQLLAERKRAECPRIKAEVGTATVDMFGYNQAIVLLNDLEYQPRPVFQSYGTYTPFLIRANADFYRSTEAPSYIISSLATVDDHFPSEDDSEALRVLLVDYDLVLAEKGWLLWKRSAFPKAVKEELTGTEVMEKNFGQEVPLSGNNLWCAIDIKERPLGRLRDFFYKPPPLFISFTDENHQESVYRILPTVARTGFILDPYLLSDVDILGLKTELAPKPKHIVSFRLIVDDSSRKYFAGTISIHLSRIAQLTPE